MNLFNISKYSSELCNKYMNQDNADTPEKNKDNLYRTEVYRVLINKLKNK